MVEVEIDEVTSILLPEESLLNTPDRRWDDLAWGIVLEAEERLNLCAILGERKLMDKAISGYTIGFSYGDHDFFFEVCYHGIYAKMGVMIKFSAPIKGQLSDIGSLLRTSTAAPDNIPLSRAYLNAYSSTVPPRDVLTKNAPFLNFSNISLLNICFDCSFSGQCTVTISLVRISVSRSVLLFERE